MKGHVEKRPQRKQRGTLPMNLKVAPDVANKALELLGKELGMFQTKHENTDAPLDAVVKRLHAERERVAMMQRGDEWGD